MKHLAFVLITGVGATTLMDLWGVARRPLLGVPPPDYGLVGRWLAHMRRGRFAHQSIAAAEPVQGERIIGWLAHYLIGIAFATLLLLLAGAEWQRQPTLAPAMIVGIVTVLAPFLLMQPGMGAGIAGRRTARPASVRIQSVITHAIFGLGLYLAALAASHFLAV